MPSPSLLEAFMLDINSQQLGRVVEDVEDVASEKLRHPEVCSVQNLRVREWEEGDDSYEEEERRRRRRRRRTTTTTLQGVQASGIGEVPGTSPPMRSIGKCGWPLENFVENRRGDQNRSRHCGTSR